MTGLKNYQQLLAENQQLQRKLAREQAKAAFGPLVASSEAVPEAIKDAVLENLLNKVAADEDFDPVDAAKVLAQYVESRPWAAPFIAAKAGAAAGSAPDVARSAQAGARAAAAAGAAQPDPQPVSVRDGIRQALERQAAGGKRF